jgi:hypothetical protein
MSGRQIVFTAVATLVIGITSALLAVGIHSLDQRVDPNDITPTHEDKTQEHEHKMLDDPMVQHILFFQ